ncbi:ATP-binding protein [Paenibacillus tarimensis]
MKDMKRWAIWILFFIFMFPMLQGCIDRSKIPEDITASGGVIDLRAVNWAIEPQVNLSGEWLFYSRLLLEPGSMWDELPVSVIPVPRSWNSYPEKSGLHNGEGYGTFRLLLLTPPGDGILSLRVPNISSAYRLWVDGKLLAEAGRVSAAAEDAEPEQNAQAVWFENGNGEHELVVQVSNYHHRRGGIWRDFKLGPSEEIIHHQMRDLAEQMVLFGSLVMIGFYHLGLFALRRQEKFTFYFGLLCLFVAVRSVVIGDAYLMEWIPGLSWEAGMKIEYTAFSLSALAGYLYIYYLFPKDASKRFLRGVILISTLLCCLVWFSPAIIYSKLLPVFQLYVITASLYALVVLWIAKRRKRDGAGLVLIGVSVFVLTIINDMSFYNEWFGAGDLVPIGLFFFIMMQSFIISSRFSNALRRVEQVSSEVRELNAHLEERIKERTEALMYSNETLEKTNKELERMEKSRRDLIANISHDLRTPMTLIQGYLEALQDGVVGDPKQQEKYVRMMLGKVGGINRLIHDLFELSKLEAGQVPFEFRNVRLSEWMDRLKEQFELDIENEAVRFEYGYQDESPAAKEQARRVIVKMDEFRIGQAISNLIYNSLKFMDEEGTLKLTFNYDEDLESVTVGVHDSGEGISEEDLPYIFDRFYKNDKSRNTASGGSGIGLAIVKEIVEAHGGSIRAESELGVGSVFWITLPAQEEKME